MKKLLVTGARGFLGWNVCQAARHAWEVVGTTFSHQEDISDIPVTKADLTDFKAVKKIFRQLRPGAVIHTAAKSDPNFCQTNPAESRRVNVDASVNIAGLCADYGIPCVFTSTDLVFDGLNAPYHEEAPVCPVNFYGEQKVLAEEGMMKRHPMIAICRLSLMFGIPGPGAKSFIQPMIEAIQTGRELQLFVDEFRTPVSVTAAVSGIFLSLEKVHGLLHIGGNKRISRYEFGELLANTLNISEARLIPSKQKDLIMAAPRPPDVSLDSTSAISLGFRPLPLSDEIKKVVGCT
ncbi:MAG: SDR family oxidoreductase [Planctomycetia bacterium]|nr:MAG: SDR family oxidoreductase [Planctomycetia bacterium]TVL95980.1 MAG: NAD(P)-dependent oxidoreductase [Candidatus Brocadia sp. BL1]HQU31042.1 SDR family oxidoreductase [Candidatus Brocadia sapporoensis]